ncbi:hypothetical protein LSTR_LSTR015155 [Laodelphax striatellus]|uniref:Uncharacterized protein n=1 Tax=Laodelphax striatellus TaxID=195883 RepID=A0A482XNA4_LAOST|nr:hypothetical protein LSTR_LSTR015155 [Laodelphax striatellus]
MAEARDKVAVTEAMNEGFPSGLSAAYVMPDKTREGLPAATAACRIKVYFAATARLLSSWKEPDHDRVVQDQNVVPFSHKAHTTSDSLCYAATKNKDVVMLLEISPS